jgi:ribosome-associated toxin RatA of RatAB toxin-antitoxin module
MSDSNYGENKISITRLESEMEQVKQEVQELKQDVKVGFDTLNTKLDCYVTRSEYSKDMQLVSDQLKKSSGTWDWIVKIVMAAIIGALLSGILIK